MSDQKIPTMTHNPRPAGSITIQPGESEEEAIEELRRENAAKAAAEEAAKPKETVKPTASEESAHE